MAEELNEGDFIVITQGELVYRRRDTKDGERSRLEILVWRVQKGEPNLAGASVVTETPEHVAPDEPAPAEPPPKARRRPYPKTALQAGGFSPN